MNRARDETIRARDEAIRARDETIRARDEALRARDEAIRAREPESWGSFLTSLVHSLTKMVMWILEQLCARILRSETEGDGEAPERRHKELPQELMDQIQGDGEAPERRHKQLPQELMDQIQARVLSDPPFSTLQNLCLVCRNWREHVLSQRFLFYVKDGVLSIFHWQRGTFEEMELPSPNLVLLACYGGLLAFANANEQKVVVVNPLTRTVSELPLRDSETFGTRSGLVTNWVVKVDLLASASEIEIRFSESRVHVLEGTGHYSLGVSYKHQDSYVEIFKLLDQQVLTGTDVPSNFSVLLLGYQLSANPTVVVGMSRQPDLIKLLVYDKALNRLESSILSDDPGVPNDTYRGFSAYKEMYGRVTPGEQLQLYEVHGNDISFLISVNSVVALFIEKLRRSPFRSAMGTDVKMKIFHFLHLGERVCHVGLLDTEESPLRCPRRLVSVLFENEADRSDLSEWTEWIPNDCDIMNFHVFQPTLASPTNDPLLRRVLYPNIR